MPFRFEADRAVILSRADVLLVDRHDASGLQRAPKIRILARLDPRRVEIRSPACGDDLGKANRFHVDDDRENRERFSPVLRCVPGGFSDSLFSQIPRDSLLPITLAWAIHRDEREISNRR